MSGQATSTASDPFGSPCSDPDDPTSTLRSAVRHHLTHSLSDLTSTIISSHSLTHSPESRLASCTWYFIHRDQTTHVHPPPIDPLPSKRNVSPEAQDGGRKHSPSAAGHRHQVTHKSTHSLTPQLPTAGRWGQRNIAALIRTLTTAGTRHGGRYASHFLPDVSCSNLSWVGGWAESETPSRPEIRGMLPAPVTFGRPWSWAALCHDSRGSLSSPPLLFS